VQGLAELDGLWVQSAPAHTVRADHQQVAAMTYKAALPPKLQRSCERLLVEQLVAQRVVEDWIMDRLGSPIVEP